MNQWPQIHLRDVMQHCLDSEPVDASRTYSFAGVYSFGRGLFVRGDQHGSETTYKTFNRLHSDDFVISQPKAWEGAVARITDEFEGMFLSPVFPTFRANKSRVSPRFLEWYLKRPSVWHEMHLKAKGMGARRESVSADSFLSLKIPLPPLPEQLEVVEWIDDLATRVSEANSEAESAVKRLDNVLMSAFHEITEGAHRNSMNDVAPLVRRQTTIDPAAEYPELGVRCFGKGTFQKPSLNGLDVGTKKLYAIEPGDLVFSNVFAWEGAIAVAKNEDKGRFGSHRFITCVPNPGVATAVFLNFYFQTPEGIEQIRDASPGGAGRNRTLGLKKLEKIKVPVPRYELQLWFDQLYEKVEAAKTTMMQAVEERNALLPSVLNQVFGGGEVE